MSFRIGIVQPGIVALPIVQRDLTILGVCDGTAEGVLSATISVQFGVGGPSIQARTVDLSSGSWLAAGLVPANIRGGDIFTLTATGVAKLKPFGLITASGSFSVTCRMMDTVPPTINVSTNPPLGPDAITVIDWTPSQTPADFRLAGTVTEGDGRMSLLQCALDAGPFVTVTSLAGTFASWEQHFSLTPGYHRFRLRATDAAGLISEAIRWINVHPTPDVVDEHTASITSWTRLEPYARNGDMGRAVSARLFDPLWMLTRQWQVGEFQGEDAGSPVMARTRATSGSITRYSLGQLPTPVPQGKPYDPARTPLETIVERRRMRPVDATDARALSLAVDAGLHFLHMLEQAGLSKSYRAAFVARFPLLALPAPLPENVDDAAGRFLQTMTGRAPDARSIAATIRSGGGANLAIDPALKIASADQLTLKNAAEAWLTWYDALVSEPQTAADDAWNPSRLEYGVSVAGALSAQAADEVTLTAAELDDGRLDWSNFDVNAGVRLGSAGDVAARALVETTIPAPVTFRGMPAVRFWELEDSKISYGLMSVGPTDLAHLMMIEYAGSYGNDWFVVPFTVPVGSLTRIDSLVVTDTFGVQQLLRPLGAAGAAAAGFSMWQHAPMRRAGDPAFAPTPNLFFLPPSLARTDDGAALEDVVFMRDEMANMAWAIERTVESAIEQPAARGNGADGTAQPTAASPDRPRYLLASTVPENWIPLVPVQVQSSNGPTVLRLQRAALLQPDGGANKINEAHSETLKALSPLRICDEEIPREGARVTRLRRLSRWTDGSLWVWTAFRREAGRGEGSSGLRYDQLISETAPTP